MPPFIPFLGYVAAGTAVATFTHRASSIAADVMEGAIRGAIKKVGEKVEKAKNAVEAAPPNPEPAAVTVQ